MKNGIYEAHFTTSMGTLGTGAVLVKDGTFHGADAVQFFRGDIDSSEVGLKVLMEVTRHNFAVDSAFGSASTFTIAWEGVAQGDAAFKMEAHPPGIDVTIYVTGKLLKEVA